MAKSKSDQRYIIERPYAKDLGADIETQIAAVLAEAQEKGVALSRADVVEAALLELPGATVTDRGVELGIAAMDAVSRLRGDKPKRTAKPKAKTKATKPAKKAPAKAVKKTAKKLPGRKAR